MDKMWMDVLLEVDRRAVGLDSWEIEFLQKLINDPPEVLSRRQKKRIDELVDRWCCD